MIVVIERSSRKFHVPKQTLGQKWKAEICIQTSNSTLQFDPTLIFAIHGLALLNSPGMA